MMKQLKELRAEKGYSQTKMANMLGISQPAYANYERGARQADYDTLSKLAEIFNVSIDYLLGRSKIQNLNDALNIPAEKTVIKVPVLGYVAAGIPISAIEDILDYEELNADEFNPSYEYFALKIKGDSMAPKIQNGDVVIIRQQPDVENGEVAVVCINGEEATCKKIKKHDDGVSLVSYNPEYEPMFFTRKEVIELPLVVLGKVVELRRKF